MLWVLVDMNTYDAGQCGKRSTVLVQCSGSVHDVRRSSKYCKSFKYSGNNNIAILALCHANVKSPSLLNS